MRESLAQACMAKGSLSQAVELLSEAFRLAPSKDLYCTLKRAAQAASVWGQTQTFANNCIAAKEGASPRDAHVMRILKIDVSILEGNLQEAAVLAASLDPINHFDLLEKLAKSLEANLPDEALAIYKRIAPPQAASGKHGGYVNAARTAITAQLLMARLGDPQPDSYVDGLAKEFARKYSFVKMLREAQSAAAEQAATSPVKKPLSR